VTTALMVLALVVGTVRTAHAAACDATSTAHQLGMSIDRPATEARDRESRTTPATADDERIAQAADRPWRYRMRSSPVVAGILWIAIALYLLWRFVLSR
jgi:hypothetical protein